MKIFEDCTRAEQIERWRECERVLVQMPEHERLNHWNMARWGIQTDCGTVACAAGHCALDPWFQEQGLRMTFKLWTCNCPDCIEAGVSGKTIGSINDVSAFFGSDGTSSIFYNDRPRPVESVIEEVREYIRSLGA
jgi:hypothetical protein